MSDQVLPKPSKSGVITPANDKAGVVEITKPTSSTATPKQTPAKIPMPPTALTALSSMSSNSIPVPSDKKDKTLNPTIKSDKSSISKPASTSTLVKPTITTNTTTSTKTVINNKTPLPKSTSAPVSPTPVKAISQSPSPLITNIVDQKDKKAVVSPAQTTVLGRPLPQTIRGENVPKGLNSSPAPTVVKTSPVPTAPKPIVSKENKEVKKPEIAKEKKSILRFLPIILGAVVLLAVVGLILSKVFNAKKSTSLPETTEKKTTTPAEQIAKRTEVVGEEKEITYWGLWEPNEVLADIITQFEKENVGIKIKYVKQSPKNYRERLQSSLSSGQGPDIFRFHASWTPMLKSYLSPIPSSVVSAKEFKDNYYPVVSEQLVSSGQFVGVPLMYDGLALFYNEEILNTANATPPSTWAELRLLAQKLTVKSANGIERAGLAIGNTTNVEHFSDILAVLMLQNGADFTKPNSQETKDALLFYTNFVTKDGVWSEKLPSSTVAFARGDVAMMFAPSWRAHEIKAQNPSLKFKTMTLPQLSDKRVAWASYWAEGINAKSKNQEITAKFLAYLNKDENLKKFYSKASETRPFGEIYPKVSMAKDLVNDGVVASYLDDATYAESWYLNSFTHDNGINDQMIKYYKDAINGVIQHEDMDEVMETLEAGVKQVLRQYKVK